MKALLVALAASAVAASAIAAPAVIAPPIMGRQTGPNLANYPVVVTCPATAQMDVTPGALPPGWTSYGLVGQLEGTDMAKFMGKDELHCNYAAPMHPDTRVTTLRLAVDEGACVKGPEREAFHCKAGTPH